MIGSRFLQLIRKSAAGGSASAFRSAATSSGTGTTVGVLLPGTVQSGDGIFVVIVTGMTLPSAPTGWTVYKTFNSRIGVYTKNAVSPSDAGTTTNFTATGLPDDWVATSFAFSSGGTIKVDSSDNGVGTSIIAPTVTPDAASGRTLVSLYATAISNTITVPGGQTQTGNVSASGGSGEAMNAGRETLSSGSATGTRTATASISTWTAVNLVVG